MHPKLQRFVTLIRMSVTSRPNASTGIRSRYLADGVKTCARAGEYVDGQAVPRRLNRGYIMGRDGTWAVGSEGSAPRVERAGLVPFGMGQTKPHHYSEILKTIWHNKRAPLFTWRVLRDGVCDGCALGTTGLKDFTMEGVHLCTVRLNLLPLNTMGAMDTRVLEDVPPLVGRPGRDLHHLAAYPTRWCAAGATAASAGSPGMKLWTSWPCASRRRRRSGLRST